MARLAFSVTAPANLLTDEEIYEITPVSELSQLLQDEHSLTLAWQGSFASGGYAMGTYRRLRGTRLAPDGSRQETTLLFVLHSAVRQASAKNRLDRTFSGPYLFCSWKKDGSRTFKLGRQGKTLQEYPSFAEGTAALIPGQFIPGGIYTRRYNLIGMIGLIARKKRERRELFRRLCSLGRQAAGMPLAGPSGDAASITPEFPENITTKGD